jgi:hypothetical protein
MITLPKKYAQGYLRPDNEFELMLPYNHCCNVGSIVKFINHKSHTECGIVLWISHSIDINHDLVRVKTFPDFTQMEFEW